MGVLCKYDGKFVIVEYSEISETVRNMRETETVRSSSDKKTCGSVRITQENSVSQRDSCFLPLFFLIVRVPTVYMAGQYCA